MGKGPKFKQSWRDLTHLKRKQKQKKTEERLKLIRGDKKPKQSKQPKAEKPVEISTVSIAVPGSILNNAQSPELRTYLAGQIARAACIYKINEVIVFNDSGEVDNAYEGNRTKNMKSCEHLATILQYLECPQYLRKHLFPIQNALKYAGLLNPLDAPHHLKKETDFPYREGVVLTMTPKSGKGSYVDVGLNKPAVVDRVLEPFYRVTVKLNPREAESNKISGVVVSPNLPATEGTYWGYTVRIANSLNEIFTKCPYVNGYDLTIGTSDKGVSVDVVDLNTTYKHCLVAFGGLNGLEYALENDTLEADDVSLLFDHYVNTCPIQGSRTIRTEEAIIISLAELRSPLRIGVSPRTGDILRT